MSEKSYVGMTQCFFCGADKNIVLDLRMKDVFERRVGYADREPCSKCAEHMKQGIILISYDPDKSEEAKADFYRTGRFLVVRDEAVQNWIDQTQEEDVRLKSALTAGMEARVLFLPDAVADMLGLPGSAEYNDAAV